MSVLHECLVEITFAVIILAVVLILGKFIIIFIQTIGKILIYLENWKFGFLYIKVVSKRYAKV